MLWSISLALFLIGALGLSSIYFFYPLYLFLFARATRISEHGPLHPAGFLPQISVVVVAHNAETLIEAKIRNCLAFDYPKDRIEFFFCSDGSTDDSDSVIRPFISREVHLISHKRHRGKARVINEVVTQCRGELLVFSDVDAILEADCLNRLVRHFADADVAGVSGARVIGGGGRSPLLSSQRRYIAVDGLIKRLEGRTGSTTSNDGKLYAIRRALFQPIHPAATDDLFVCLTIVEQGKRFSYEPSARATIAKPAINLRHEIHRRRRIVCRSLTGIWVKRALLNPIRFRAFAIGLLVNKVLRRAQPFFLILLFFSSLSLATLNALFWPLFGVQAVFYLLAALHWPVSRFGWPLPGSVGWAVELAAYFCIGNLGTMLGVIDFLSGVRYVAWSPLKTAPSG